MAVRLLIKVTEDPEVDPKNGYRAYDVVDVRPASVEWGTAEVGPTWLRVELGDVDPPDVAFLLEEETEPGGKYEHDLGIFRPKRVTRRKYALKYAKLNPPQQAQVDDAIATNTTLVLPNASGMVDWLERKIDGSDPPGQG